MGKAIAIGREVPSGRGPIAARDVDTIVAAQISDEGDLKHPPMMPDPGSESRNLGSRSAFGDSRGKCARRLRQRSSSRFLKQVVGSDPLGTARFSPMSDGNPM